MQVAGHPEILAIHAEVVSRMSEMAVSLELHNTGHSGGEAEVRALVEHALSDRPGDWRMSIVGSRENDSWEMKILGPNGLSGPTHWSEARESISLWRLLMWFRGCCRRRWRWDEATDQRMNYCLQFREAHRTPVKVHIDPCWASTTKLRQKPTTVEEGHRKQ
jgi:hypothetical protein